MTNFDRVVGLMGASVVAIACASPAVAQTRTYSIPAQSAASGVAALARQSDQQILISARDAKGKKTRQVRGEMTVEQAFAQLLAGSGLTAKRTGAGAWAVVQGGNADAAPARTEVPASIAVPNAAASTVVDARTGAALKGALVELIDTGEKTSTGNLGEFRFPGKVGNFNIRISYLGYPPYELSVELRDGRATSGILLSDGSANGEIIVTAYRSARAQALNQERTSENSKTVISADLLGQFDGTTIADSLRRAPGVAFQPDAQTGEGRNIIVRGLSPEFNTVTLNGLRVPVGNGVDRSPQLNNILTDSISSITINKTLLPNQDGSGTGGLIEIETKGALDRPRRSASLVIEGAKAPKGFLDEFSIAGSASARFGASENFGVSASVQYRDRSIQSLRVSSEAYLPGPYLPATNSGRQIQNAAMIDPRTPFPFEEGVDKLFPTSFAFSQEKPTVKDLSVVLSAQWKIGDHSNLRLDYTRAQQKTDIYSSSLNFAPIAGYVRTPVSALGGEIRPVYTSEDFSAPGINIAVLRGAEVRKAQYTTDTISFKGESVFGKLALNYRLGYAGGNQKNEFISISSSLFNYTTPLDRSHLDGAAVANAFEGRITSLFSPLGNSPINVPLLNASGYAVVNDESLYSAPYGFYSPREEGFNKRYTGAFDLKYDLDSSVLKYIQSGIFWERSRSYTRGDPSISFYANPGVSVSDVGLEFGYNPLQPLGRDAGFRVISEAGARSFFLDPSFLDGSNPLYSLDTVGYNPLTQDTFTEEDDLAGFVQTHLQFGKFEIIGGLRIEKISTKTRATSGSILYDENDEFDFEFYQRNLVVRDYNGSNYNFLPRFTINYRPAENLVARIGFYQSIARPAISQLNSDIAYYLNLRPAYGPNRNQPSLQIVSGNPNLDASVTNNFDLSLEYYDKDIGAIKFAAFYKPTSKPFFQNSTTLSEVPNGLELPDDPRFQNLPADTYVSYEYPTNSDKSSKLWGFEISIEKKIDFISSSLSGFGIFANYTYTDSSRRFFGSTGFGEPYFVDGVSYGSQPKHSGTAALTYSKSGLDASLSFTKQARYMSAYEWWGLGRFQNSYDTLDFKAAYQTRILGSALAFTLEASNLLKGTSDANLVNSGGNASGTIGGAMGGSYLGGRSLRLGASLRF
jgi:TonB-dependent receptor